MNAVIQGAKGGKGASPRTPVEAPDSLRSKAYARVIDVVSEGEIGGLVNGFKSVFFDGVPYENEDGSKNFTDVFLDWRWGTQGQTAMDAFSDQETEQTVAVEVLAASPVTRTIVNPLADTVRVTIQVPALAATDLNNGDVGGTAVLFAIDIQSAGGGFVEKVRQNISGKSVNGYQRSVRVPLAGGGPYDVRVRRLTPDSTTQYLQNKTFFQSYTEIVSTKLRYPNTAAFGLIVDSQQFSRIPVRGYDLLGVRCEIPSNYNPITRTTTGVWNGTWTIGWTNNPAWLFRWLVVEDRFGLGRLVDAALLNKWSLYAIAQYCDALVPDGRGGTEPRFTCNVYLQEQREAYALLAEMASIFRGLVYWSGAGIDFAQDAPADPALAYTNANVVDGSFEYSDADAAVRYTQVLVRWNDPVDQFRAKTILVDDEKGIARYGLVSTSIVAVGCTSAGQAVRAGKWFLYTNLYEAEVVNFRVGTDGELAGPGKIIKIADARKAQERTGGRLRSATASAITVDAPVTLNPGESYTLYLMQPAAMSEPARPLATRPVVNGPGTWDVLNLASPLEAAPVEHSIWVLASGEVQPTTWRVLAVREVEGKPQYDVLAVSHNPSKFNAIENGWALESYPVSRLTADSKPITGLSLSESLFLDRGIARVKLSVGYTSTQVGQRYLVSWRRNQATWQTLPQTTQTTIDILDAEPGNYEVAVVAINALGNASPPVTGVLTVLGKTAPPANVTGLYATLEPFGVRIGWNAVPDLDVFEYELRVGGTTWESAAPLTGAATRVGGTDYPWQLRAAGTYKLWIKAVDDGGRFSATAATIDLVIAAPGAPSASGGFTGADYMLTWAAAPGSFATDRYRVRRGAVFATATLIAEPYTTRFGGRADWTGSASFWITQIDVAGNESAPREVQLVVTPPAAPPGFQADVIINQLQFRWGKPAATLPIVRYILRRGATFGSALVIGDKSGDQTFTTHQEPAGGTYTYWISAVDSAGNEGAAASLTQRVDTPSNFSLQRDWVDDFTGTKVNCIVENGALLAPLDTTETFDAHFASRGWASPQAQIDAGYPRFYQPGAASSSYERVFDYGTSIGATLIALTLTSQIITGAVTVATTISVSNTSAAGPWTDFAGVASVFATNFRWVKVKLDFTASGGDDLIEVSGLNLRLALKKDTESGAKVAADFVSGVCTVTLTKPWIDVDRITVTPNTTARREATAFFVDAPNPTSFQVRIWDPTTGNLTPTDFFWGVDGVL
ncbi:phage tail protein [Arenimonas sp.]|uniref:host specificity protein J n=1 Tax=Arenimonas sp. TaxID=1872635 RepID=UPI0025C6CA27|nr:phage tail protein [Arenimonas sp.]